MSPISLLLTLYPFLVQVSTSDISDVQVQKEFLDRINQLSKFIDYVVLKDSPKVPGGPNGGSSLQQEFICGHDERQVTSVNETTAKIDICCLDRKGSISSCSSTRCQSVDLTARQPLTTVRTCLPASKSCGAKNKNVNGNRGITTTTGNRFFCTGIIDIYESIGCGKTSQKTVQLNGQQGRNGQARFCCSGSCSNYFDCPTTRSVPESKTPGGKVSKDRVSKDRVSREQVSREQVSKYQGVTSRSCCQSSGQEYCDGDQFTQPDYGPEYKPPPAGVPTQAPTKSPSSEETSKPKQSKKKKKQSKKKPSTTKPPTTKPSTTKPPTTKPPSGSDGQQQQQQEEQQQSVVVNCRTTNAELIRSFKESTDILERISNRINTGLRIAAAGGSDRMGSGTIGGSVIGSNGTDLNLLRTQNQSASEFIRALASIPNQVFSVISQISKSATRDIGPDFFHWITRFEHSLH